MEHQYSIDIIVDKQMLENEYRKVAKEIQEIPTKKERKEKMNESMKRFQELMNEALQCVENLKTETKNVEKEMIAERQAQLDMFLADLHEFAEYVKPLKEYVTVKFPGDNRYYIYFAPDGAFGLRRETDRFMGWISQRDFKLFTSYHWVNVLGSILADNNKEFARKNLCELLDAWDKDWFAHRLLRECEQILAQMAKEANDAYDNAKTSLSEAKRMEEK